MRKLFLFLTLFLFAGITFGQTVVTQAEYFWDTDPGAGNGTALLVTDGAFDEAIEDLFQNGIPTGALSVGPHSFQMRVKGFDGTWSPVFRQTIYVAATPVLLTRTVRITQGEYFWDTDPGAGNGTPLLATDGAFDEAIEDLFQNGISVAALSVGPHSFQVRVKGFDGTWSGVFKQTIVVEATPVLISRNVRVTQGEYFWDTDPGAGNGTPLLATDGAFDEAIEDLFQNGISVAALSVGPHSFQVRVKGFDGTWSGVFKQTIVVEATPVLISRNVRVTQGEYFWDTDPGAGNGTPLLATDGAFDEAIEDLFQNGISIAALSTGAHSFQVRVKGLDGTWSAVFKQTIYLNGPLTTITRSSRVIQGEYFWDTDPGAGNGTPLFVTDGSFDEPIEALFRNGIDPSLLSLGPHSFQVRVRGLDGGWSPVFKQTIFIECAAPTSPTIVISTPNNTICAGQPATFTATVTNGGNTPTYTWRVNGNPSGSNAATFTTSSLNPGDVVTCDLLSNSGCASPLFVTSNSISITVTPTVTPTITISASPGNSICVGTTVTFTATISNGGGSPVYTWKINGVPTGTNSSTFVSSSLNNGDVITCELTSSATCAVPAVLTSNSITMTVSPIVTPSVTISANTGTTICAGTNVTFTATIANGGGSPAYQWYVNGSPVGTNSATYSSPGLANGNTVTCILTSSNGCVTSSTATSNTLTMTVNPSIATSVSISSSPSGPICAGTSVTFTATPVNGGTPTYQWFVNGSPVGGNSATYVTTGLANTDVVTCQMLSSLSCPSPATATSNSIVMTVNPVVTPTISISASPGTTICAGTNVTFTASITNGGSSPTYQWFVNGSPVGTNSPTYSSSSLTNGNTVTCTLTSNAPCPTTTTANSNTLTITVTTPVTPTVSISANPGTTICAGTNVTFTATITNGGGSPSYQWYVNGSPVGTNASTYSSSGLASGNTVTCVLTSSNSCVTSSTATSNTLTMTVNPSVATSVSISSSPSGPICAGTSVTFTATPVNGGTPTYQWFVNGSPVGGNSATYVTTSLGNGDVVTCQMLSSLSCPSPATATSNSIAMTVNPVVTPTINITANPGTTICAGTNVTFTATITNGGSSPTYQWFVNGSPVGTNSPTYSSSSLTNGNTVTCTLTSNAPCPTTTTANSNTLTITVTTPVTPTVSISANPGTTICAGTNVTFTATITNGGGSPSYQWFVNGSPAGTNSPTYSTTTLASGNTVSCVLTSSNSCVTSSTASSNTLTMTVNPTVATSVSISSNPSGAICAGTSVTFTATPVNGGTPTYQWFVNGSPVGGNSATYVTTSLGNGDVVTCQMASSLSCPSPANATSNSIVMTVNPVVTPTINITANPGTTICAGTNVTFTATITNGGSSPTYQWFVNGSPVGGNSPTYASSSLTNGNTVTCTVTSNAPCATPVSVNSNTLTITITAPLTPTVSISASTGTTICAGTNVTFSSSISNGGANPIYQWYVNGTPVGANSPLFSSSGLNNGDAVTCVITTSLTCVTSNTASSNTISFTVTPVVTPTISISANPAFPVCPGTAVTFTSSISNGGSSPSFQWYVNGISAGVTASTFTTSTLNAGDQVTCVLNSSEPCVTSAAVSSNAIVASFLSLNTGVTVSGPVLTAQQAGATYQWVNCNNGFAPIAGATSQSFTPTVTGNYAVIVTLSGCTDTSACNNVIIAGLPAQGGGLDWAVYPNPNEGLFTVDPGQTSGQAEITITDALGQVVKSERVNFSGPFELGLDVTAGVYTLHLHWGDLDSQVKLVITR